MLRSAINAPLPGWVRAPLELGRDVGVELARGRDNHASFPRSRAAVHVEEEAGGLGPGP